MLYVVKFPPGKTGKPVTYEVVLDDTSGKALLVRFHVVQRPGGHPDYWHTIWAVQGLLGAPRRPLAKGRVRKAIEWAIATWKVANPSRAREWRPPKMHPAAGSAPRRENGRLYGMVKARMHNPKVKKRPQA